MLWVDLIEIAYSAILSTMSNGSPTDGPVEAVSTTQRTMYLELEPGVAPVTDHGVINAAEVGDVDVSEVAPLLDFATSMVDVPDFSNVLEADGHPPLEGDGDQNPN